jgi:hypothetical protein
VWFYFEGGGSSTTMYNVFLIQKKKNKNVLGALVEEVLRNYTY